MRGKSTPSDWRIRRYPNQRECMGPLRYHNMEAPRNEPGECQSIRGWIYAYPQELRREKHNTKKFRDIHGADTYGWLGHGRSWCNSSRYGGSLWSGKRW